MELIFALLKLLTSDSPIYWSLKNTVFENGDSPNLVVVATRIGVFCSAQQHYNLVVHICIDGSDLIRTPIDLNSPHCSD